MRLLNISAMVNTKEALKIWIKTYRMCYLLQNFRRGKNGSPAKKKKKQR